MEYYMRRWESENREVKKTISNTQIEENEKVQFAMQGTRSPRATDGQPTKQTGTVRTQSYLRLAGQPLQNKWKQVIM